VDNIIIAKNISLGYGDNKIIKESSFSIKKKDFVIISGASGSGKSTLLKSLYADLEVNNGFLNVAGINIKNMNTQNKNLLRRHLGVVFQDFKLISEWDIERNIMLPLLINGHKKDTATAQAQKLLSHVNLSIKSMKFPYELSGGEQQRVALARALAHNPLIILADEPTGNLDDYSSDMVWTLLKSANKQLNITIVVVTHRIPTDLGIDYRHFQIHDGRIHEIS